MKFRIWDAVENTYANKADFVLNADGVLLRSDMSAAPSHFHIEYSIGTFIDKSKRSWLLYENDIVEFSKTQNVWGKDGYGLEDRCQTGLVTISKKGDVVLRYAKSISQPIKSTSKLRLVGNGHTDCCKYGLKSPEEISSMDDKKKSTKKALAVQKYQCYGCANFTGDMAGCFKEGWLNYSCENHIPTGVTHLPEGFKIDNGAVYIIPNTRRSKFHSASKLYKQKSEDGFTLVRTEDDLIFVILKDCMNEIDCPEVGECKIKTSGGE